MREEGKEETDRESQRENREKQRVMEEQRREKDETRSILMMCCAFCVLEG